MKWERIAAHQERSARGHLVTAVRYPASPSGWMFDAWAPARAQGEPQARYRRGEQMSQQRVMLGSYTTAQAARAACEERQRGVDD